jgi:hypothetical protein
VGTQGSVKETSWRRTIRRGSCRGLPPGPRLPPLHEIPPAIVPNAKSPILLRRRSPAAHAGASNYAAKIRRSFQAFLDDYEGTSANCESNKAVGQMTTAAAQWEGGLCNSGATTGGNDVRSSTWSLNEGCPVEEDMGFLTPPCS